jgi:predicted RecA/RadA family phage recombinase
MAFKLRSTRYKAIEVVLAADVAAGDYATSGSVNGFYQFGGLDTFPATLVVEAEQVEVVKAAGQAWVPGEPVYWHLTNLNVTNIATGAELIGYVHEAALSAAVVGVITFDGNAEFLKA